MVPSPSFPPISDAAFVALFVGLAAAAIAFQQWRVARAKLNLDLFEHRYALYHLLWGFLSSHAHDLSIDEDHKLQNSIPKFYFLFGEDIGDFAERALSMASLQRIRYRTANGLDATPQQAEEANHQLVEHSEWFTAQVKSLRARFAPYMAFDKWH